MHADLTLLVALDAADEHVSDLERRLAAARARPAEGRAARDAAAEAARAARAAWEAARDEERALNRKLAEYETRRQGAVRALETGAGSPEAAERQLAQVREILDQTETGILEAMERQAELAPPRDAAQAALAAAEAKLAEIEAAAPGEIATLETELRLAVGARDVARGPVSTHLLAAYDGLRIRKRRPVTLIHKDTCKACNTLVSAQRIADAARGSALINCHNCGRFLVPPS